MCLPSVCRTEWHLFLLFPVIFFFWGSREEFLFYMQKSVGLTLWSSWDKPQSSGKWVIRGCGFQGFVLLNSLFAPLLNLHKVQTPHCLAGTLTGNCFTLSNPQKWDSWLLGLYRASSCSPPAHLGTQQSKRWTTLTLRFTCFTHSSRLFTGVHGVTVQAIGALLEVQASITW